MSSLAMVPNQVAKEHVKDLYVQNIRHYLLKIIDDFPGSQNLTREVKENMLNSLVTFNVAAIAKFVAGQREHGGDIRDRDLEVEGQYEQIDAFWYGKFGAGGWPMKPGSEVTKHP